MRDGVVDYESLHRLVELQIAGGVCGLVPVGTTGESPTLSYEEHIEVVRQTVQAVKGRVPVIAGSGANSTAEAVHLTRRAEEAGADAFLQVTPYYNKPTQEGLLAHFSAVAEVTERPIVLYSIPGRCVIEIAPETVSRLHERHPHICAIKESGGNCDRVAEILHATGNNVVVVSGDDSLTLPFLAVGAQGVISVASNLLPQAVARMVNSAREGNLAAATEQHLALYPVFKDLFLDPNPVPVKYALKRAGYLLSDEVRLPLTPARPATREKLEAHLRRHGLLPA